MKTTVRRPKPRIFYPFVSVFLVAIYVGWALLRPLSDLMPAQSSLAITATTPAFNLAWPGSQSAVGIVGSEILETHGVATKLPIASVAKVITALVVLQQKPLSLGQQGPLITLGPSDVALYQHYTANDGSVIPVVNGEQISQYQALQAIMLPSANNIADSLAIWAYGSLDSYKVAASQYLKANSLNDTQIGADASGLAPDSVSTAKDLANLGRLAMQNPVLSQIVGQSTAAGLPVVGAVKNVNSLIGTDSIVGIKTGNTEQAGGVYLSASKVTINDKQVTVVTSIIGAQNLYSAMRDSLPLIRSAQKNFSSVSLAKKGQALGQYDLPWGGSVKAISANELQTTSWNGSKLVAKVELQPISPVGAGAGQTVGKIYLPASATADKKTVDIKLSYAIPGPSLTWKLTHPGWPF